MERIEKTVFLSYRRTNALGARAIYQNLTYHGYDVFFDFDGIASGDFESIILENIRSRAHFVLLLTPSALERCGEPGDWLRREIEAAINIKRNIVPLMLEGFDFGAPAIATQLTGKLAALKSYNALPVPVEYFDEAMERLRSRFLNVPLAAVLHPASSLAQRAAKKQKAAADAAPEVQKKELTAQQWFERGFAAVDNGEKLRFYSEAIRLSPDFARAYNARGHALSTAGDLKGALRDYDQAVRFQPDFAVAYYNRGGTRAALGDSAGELRDYSEAIRLDPNDPNPWNNRGNARWARGDLDGALQDLNEALRLNPAMAEAFTNRANVRDAKGDLDGALRDYDEAIRLRPDIAMTFNNRGITRQTKGDMQGALGDFSEAIRLKPDYAEAFFDRGVLRCHIGDADGGLQDFNEAILLKPNFALAFAGRSRARKAKGDLRGAQSDSAEATRLGYGK